MEEPQSIDWIAVCHGAVRSSSIETPFLPCINDRFCASDQLKHNSLILIDPSLRKTHLAEKFPLKNLITHFTAKCICGQQIPQGFVWLSSHSDVPSAEALLMTNRSQGTVWEEIADRHFFNMLRRLKVTTTAQTLFTSALLYILNLRMETEACSGSLKDFPEPFQFVVFGFCHHPHTMDGKTSALIEKAAQAFPAIKEDIVSIKIIESVQPVRSVAGNIRLDI